MKGLLLGICFSGGVAEDVLAGIVERGERGVREEEGAKEVFWGFGRTVFAPESAAALSKGLQKGISGDETIGKERSPPDRLAKKKKCKWRRFFRFDAPSGRVHVDSRTRVRPSPRWISRGFHAGLWS